MMRTHVRFHHFHVALVHDFHLRVHHVNLCVRGVEACSRCFMSALRPGEQAHNGPDIPLHEVDSVISAESPSGEDPECQETVTTALRV